MKSVRGAFVVVEGCDRSGKTTQCKKLVSALNSCSIPAEYMNFPDRSTPVGRLINDYLTKKEEFPDKTIHLLFSANRWELAPKIENLLQQGTTVIVDRYAYSGVAFSAIKPGMDLEWCKRPDDGLPKPDLVLLLTLTPAVMAARAGYGSERYEQGDIQALVGQLFKSMKDPTWKEIDANKSVEDLNEELLRITKEVVEQSKSLPIGKFYGDGRNKLEEDELLESISVEQPTKRIRLWQPRIDQQNSLQRINYMNRFALAASNYFHADRQRKDEIITKITKIDNEINNIRISFEKLLAVKERLEGSASTSSDVEKPITYQSLASRIYAENKKKAEDFQKSFHHLNSNLCVKLPLDQSIINDVIEKNKQSFSAFKLKLQKHLFEKKRALELENIQATKNYNNNMAEWHEKLEVIESSEERKNEQEVYRKFFEKVFPKEKPKERCYLSDEVRLKELNEMRSNSVAIPPLLDSDQRKRTFQNNNNLIRDFPREYYLDKNKTTWTDEEKNMFKEKFVLYPKEFSKIASFLENKSLKDCVQYYYQSKKDENYKGLLKRSRKRKRDLILNEPEDPMESLFNSVTGVMTRQQREHIRKQQHWRDTSGALLSQQTVATKPKPSLLEKHTSNSRTYSYDS